MVRPSKRTAIGQDPRLQRLEEQFSLMKERFQMGNELRLRWKPDEENRMSGEVNGRTIYVYDADEAKALSTLKHEFVEYVLTTELVTPYKRLINKLISLFEEEMYDRKEKLVERLQELTE